MRKLAWALLGAASLLPLLWPGDTPWINDEPLIIQKALNGFAAQGLRGSLGFSYGPMAIWIYALLLQLTHDPIVLVQIRAAIFMAMTLGALLWLAASVKRLQPAFASVALVSPYLWIYARELWDNTWLIPLGALAVAAYIAHNAQPARWRFSVAVLSLVAAALIHPMVLPLVLGVAFHALRFHRAWLRAHRLTLGALAALAVLLAAPWLFSMLHPAVESARWPEPRMAPPGDPPHAWWMPFFFPLLGGRLLSAQGIEYFLGEGWSDTNVTIGLAFATSMLHALVWIGMAIAFVRVRAGLRGNLPQDTDFHLAFVGCAVAVIHWLMQVILQRHTHPHYYNGVWISFVYFAWIALSDPPGHATLRAAIRAVGLSAVGATAIVLGFVVLHIHRTGGTHGIHYGPVLSTQVEAARKLGRFHPDSPLTIEVENMRMFPHALPILRQLIGATGDPNGPQKALRLRYRGPVGGWLIVD